GPYRNDKEARAVQNGALPPNLSVIAKARDLHNGGFWLNHIGKMAVDIANGYQEGGPDYIYNLLTNYAEPPADMKMADGMNYNRA
ncbi:cytochrome c1, partial [Acinetobacter baumannii]